ncbi:hypothetical protein HDU76_006120, partial [Blyttiomyces sp. JEL0837]
MNETTAPGDYVLSWDDRDLPKEQWERIRIEISAIRKGKRKPGDDTIKRPPLKKKRTTKNEVVAPAIKPTISKPTTASTITPTKTPNPRKTSSK